VHRRHKIAGFLFSGVVAALLVYSHPALLQAESVAPQEEDFLAAGDSLHDALRPAAALEAYRRAFAKNPAGYEEAWKFARAQIDVAKQIQDDNREELRDSLYWVAQLYAEAAIRADSTDAEGYFMLSNALGRLSRTRGGRERVRYARQIYDLAAKALELDPGHDGAHHVLAAWHAEIMRLSGLSRTVARTFLGGGFMERASLDSALAHIERAVEIRPTSITHRLELAEIYMDLERWSDARRELTEIRELPTEDVLDPQLREQAIHLLNEVSGRE
jgi:tetratricopeptide (TPR) repeat protein